MRTAVVVARETMARWIVQPPLTGLGHGTDRRHVVQSLARQVQPCAVEISEQRVVHAPNLRAGAAA